MRYLCNTFDQNHQNAKMYVLLVQGKTRKEAWEQYKQWFADKVIGLPQATECHTVQELVNENIVGVYAKD